MVYHAGLPKNIKTLFKDDGAENFQLFLQWYLENSEMSVDFLI